MKPLHGALLFTFLGIAIWLLGEWNDQASLVSVNATDNAAPAEANPIVDGSAKISIPGLATLKTFRGAAIDGSLKVDQSGHLMINLDLRHWIDFHLAAIGEIPLDDIVAIMRSEITQLPHPGQKQANQVLDNYLGYLDALQRYDVEQQKRVAEASLEEMINRTRWQQRLRKEWFAPKTVAVFFEADEILDNYTVTRLELQKQGASETELLALENELPLAVRLMRSETRKVVNLEKAEANLKEQGITAEELNSWRREQYGDVVADRLSEVDQRRNEWTSRLTNYESYKKTLDANGLSDTDRRKLLQSYRDTHFSELEKKRLSAALILLAEGQ